MADFFGKGIGVAAGFDLGAAAPLDTRTVVTNMEELQAHIDGGRAYEGMMIYVEADAKMYIITKGEEGFGYEEFGFNQEKFNEGIAEVVNKVAALESKDEKQDTRLGVIEELMGLGGGEGDTSALDKIAEDITALKVTVGDETAGLVADMAAAEGRLDTLEAIDHNAYKAADEEIRILAQQGVDNAAAAKAAAEAAQADVDTLEGKVAVLEAIEHDAYKAADEKVLADAKTDAAEKVAVEKERAEGVEGELAGRLTALENKEEHTHGNKDVLDGITADKVTAWDGAEQAAKDYADEAIAALVGSAPEAMDTLGELAEAIKEHGDVYTAYVAEVSEDLKGKVDKVEGSRLVSEEEIAAFEAKADLKDVQDAQAAAEKVATDGDAALKAQIDALKGDGQGSVAEQIGAAKEELQGSIAAAAQSATDAQSAAQAAQGTADQAVQDAAAAQTAADTAQSTANQAVQDAAAAQTAADTAQSTANQAQQDVDALESVVGVAAKDGEAATGLFAEIAELKAKDIAIEQKDIAQDTRLALVEEKLGLGGGEGGTSTVEKFANDIAGLKSAVGQAAKDGEAATGLFAEIAALQARDRELQGSIDAEAQRADTEEKRIVGLVNGLSGRMDNAEEAIGQAQVDIQGLEDTINANAEADGKLQGRMDALEGVVGKAAVEGEEPQVATGLFAEIAALKEADAALAAKDAELAAAIGAPSEKDGEGKVIVAATGIYSHIEALHNGVANTFASVKAEIKEDGKLHTSVGGTTISEVDVPVMDEEDITTVLAGILGGDMD